MFESPVAGQLAVCCWGGGADMSSQAQTSNAEPYGGLTGVFSEMNMNTAAATPKSTVQALHTVKCLYQFDGQAGELSFVPDQILEIIEKPVDSPDWWRARDLTTGKNGLIPANYVEMVKDANVNSLQFQGDSSVLQPQTNLEDEPYYKGPIGRQKAEDLLRTASSGQFLVRKAESCPRNDQYSISVRAMNKTRHFRIAFTENSYKIGAKQFPNFAQLLEHYSRLPIYVSNDSSEKLTLSTHV